MPFNQLKQNIVRGFVTLLLFQNTLLFAQDHEAILENAMRKLDNDYLNSWSFTETAKDTESTKVGRYDASQAPDARWTLLTVDDRPPTAEEMEQYAKEKTPQTKSEEEKDDNEIRVKIEPGSVTLLEETESYYLFRFAPADDEEGFLEFVEATSKVIKSGPYVEYINFLATKPFKPRTGVKVKELKTRLGFGPAFEGGPIVPLTVDTRIKARAMLVMNIDEDLSVSYSNYVAKPNPGSATQQAGDTR